MGTRKSHFCGCYTLEMCPICPLLSPRYVHSMNRAGLSFSLALNPLSDRSEAELAAMRGSKRGKTPNKGLPFLSQLYTGVQVPDSLDWRLNGECVCVCVCESERYRYIWCV